MDQRILLVFDSGYMVDKKTGGFGLGIRFLGKRNWSIDFGMGQTLFPEDKKKYIPDFKIISFEKFMGDIGFPFIGFHKKF